MIEVYPAGTKCKIGGTIDAVITGICISESGIEYRCAWWEGNSRKQEWMFPYEICTEATPTKKIGFHQ